MSVLADATANVSLALLRLSRRLRGTITYDATMPRTWGTGATLVRNLVLMCPEAIHAVYVSDKRDPDRFHDEAITCAEEAGVSVVHDEKAVDARVGGRHYSVVAEVNKRNDVIEPGSHVVLVNPSTLGNVGSIMRSALGFGIHDIAIVKDSFDTFSPSIIRSSMGARLLVRVEVFPTIEEYVARFPENTRYAFMLDTAKTLEKVVKREPFSLVFGNESTGLPSEYADLCEPVFIEQSADVDSLNLAVAAAIALYRMTVRPGDGE